MNHFASLSFRHLAFVSLFGASSMAGCYAGADSVDPTGHDTQSAVGSITAAPVCRSGAARPAGVALDVCAVFPSRCVAPRAAAAARVANGLLKISSIARALARRRISVATARTSIRDAAEPVFAAARVPAAAVARALAQIDDLASRNGALVGTRAMTPGRFVTSLSLPYLAGVAQGGDPNSGAIADTTVTTTLNSGWKISVEPFEIWEEMTVTTVETVDETYSETCDDDGNCTCDE